MPMSNRQLNRAMNGLRPGDVLTNLNCHGCQGRKILVLARVGEDRYDFSARADEINIVRDREGPWRWHESEQVFRNRDGTAHDHIGSEVEVLEGAGLRELAWYRELPNPGLARFHIDPRNALGHFRDPSTEAKIEAIINRSDDNEGFARDLQQAVEFIFGSSSEMIDERRMRYLVSLVHAAGQKFGRSRGLGVDDILGAVIMSGGGMMGDLPPELREALGGLHSRSRRERGGNGRDHHASAARGG